MGKFEKGKSGNPVGRPKGSKNIKSWPIRNKLSNWMNESVDDVLIEVSKLKGKQLITAFLEISEYVLPKLQRKEPTFDLSNMSEDEVEHLIELIENRNNDKKREA